MSTENEYQVETKEEKSIKTLLLLLQMALLHAIVLYGEYHLEIDIK